MSSLRRIIASRRNGALSRGPVTPEGKQISAENAVTHGLCAQSIVLSNESKERFLQLHQSFLDEFQPESEIEALCIEQMAAAVWRIRRAWAIETSLLDHQLDSAAPGHETDQSTRVALAFKELQDTSRAVNTLGTHQGRLQREYDRALQRLHLIQQARAGRKNEVEPSPISGHSQQEAHD